MDNYNYFMFLNSIIAKCNYCYGRVGKSNNTQVTSRFTNKKKKKYNRFTDEWSSAYCPMRRRRCVAHNIIIRDITNYCAVPVNCYKL